MVLELQWNEISGLLECLCNTILDNQTGTEYGQMVKSIPDGFTQCGIVVAAAPCFMIEEEGEERGGGEGGEQQCDDASGLTGNRFCHPLVMSAMGMGKE